MIPAEKRLDAAHEALIWEEDSSAGRLLTSGRASHAAFPRARRFNRLVVPLAWALSRRGLDEALLRCWLNDSLDVYASFVDRADCLAKVKTETVWLVSSAQPPDRDVWSGEVEFGDDGTPLVRCFQATLASRLPRPLRDLAWQGAVDHFVGHLYGYYSDPADTRAYDEAVACHYQHLAAQVRALDDWRYRLIKHLIPFAYWAHKGIRCSTYVKLEKIGSP
jgi:hypothetical protein